LVHSEVGGKAVRLFLLLVALFLGVNLLNVVNSYVGRDFMSAIAERDTDGYVREALLYVLVFAASTAVAVYLRYCEERLGLIWRAFMTRSFVDLYLKYPTYYRINDETIRREVVEFPDQRITEDVRTFTVTTLSFILLMVNGVFTIVLFSGVLWSISPWLFGAALAYSVAGSYCAVRLGLPLVDLNYAQLDKEAAFRSDLIHVREKAESVALLHRENEIKPRLHGKIAGLAENFRKIIQVNRNLGFFATGYNYLVQIIPVLLVAPLYMRGEVEFGVVTQSVMAFAMLVGSFSLIVNWFQSISSYYAVIQRLINFWYAIEVAQSETVSGLDVREEDDRVEYDGVTLHSPVDGHVLVRELSVKIPHGTRTLVTGSDEAAKDALFKATVGIYDAGTGCVRRPTLDRIMFLPERAYLPPGTLRQALVPTELDGRIDAAAIVETLGLLGIEGVLERAGGLDEEHDWDKLFSLHEQRFVSFARILLVSPRFAVLYNPFKGLNAETASRMLGILSERGITYLTVGHEGQREGDDHAEDYDALLELAPNGGWNWRPLK
jgi:putative ATP-binding cassette transporter